MHTGDSGADKVHTDDGDEVHTALSVGVEVDTADVDGQISDRQRPDPGPLCPHLGPLSYLQKCRYS